MKFEHYMHTQTETRLAFSEYNAATRLIEICQIRERTAELNSQSFESVAKGKLQESIGEINERERKIGLAFIRYATYGRTDKPGGDERNE